MVAVKTIYIVGPTASGKTALSVELAGIMNAEIVCADSQTIRRAMNIGTAKPDINERRGIVHHMLDVIDPYDDFSVADFQRMARATIDGIRHRKKSVIVVGGTGLYIDSLYFNYRFPELARTLPATRRVLVELSVGELQERVREEGLAMPENDKNPRHLINVLLRQGQVGEKNDPDPGDIIVGINPGREVLLQRIQQRVDTMFEGGFIDEVRSIVETYGRPPITFDAIGYRIALRLLDGDINESEARELFMIADRQYAKRQIMWFKRNPHIVWFETPESAKSYILGL